MLNSLESSNNVNGAPLNLALRVRYKCLDKIRLDEIRMRIVLELNY